MEVFYDRIVTAIGDENYDTHMTTESRESESKTDANVNRGPNEHEGRTSIRVIDPV